MYKSYIIFSERCALKKINVTSNNVKVIKRGSLLKYIKRDLLESDKILSIDKIDDIYHKLGKYCLANDNLKQLHIDGIKYKKANKI